jgi:hypothetical protein
MSLNYLQFIIMTSDSIKKVLDTSQLKQFDLDKLPITTEQFRFIVNYFITNLFAVLYGYRLTGSYLAASLFSLGLIIIHTNLPNKHVPYCNLAGACVSLGAYYALAFIEKMMK